MLIFLSLFSSGVPVKPINTAFGMIVFIAVWSLPDAERSLVCRTQDVPDNVTAQEDGWRAMRITGTLDFSLIGVLAGISAVLAENGIGIFVLSTYDTDYILTKQETYARALQLLAQAGYRIIE